MNPANLRSERFSGNSGEFFDVQRVCKRPVYRAAYRLLTPAYDAAYLDAYLSFSGRAESCAKNVFRPVTWLEKIAPQRPSWQFSGFCL
jgi:hypothetical protein